MFAFSNLIFTIQRPQNSWQILGYEQIQNDGRPITIECVQKRENENKSISFQMHAKIKLESNPVINNGTLEFPTTEMKALSNILRYYSYLISIAEVNKVQISSPYHSRGFIPENSSEKEHLDSSQGFPSGFDMRMIMSDNFFKTIVSNQLLDRQIGVRLMSNINSIDSPLSKFKELVRLFENAFAESSNKLASLLFQFLSTATSAQYTRAEIDSWMVADRHGATHADLKLTTFLVHDEDVVNDIDRITQAGYDVLFNKTVWHDNSITRRNLSTPSSIINPTEMIVHKNVIENSGFTITDEDMPFYAVMEDDSELPTDSFTPPSEWWHRNSDQPK